MRKKLIEALQAHKMRICTVESCTAGLIASKLTDTPGSSAWFERGFVVYSDESKEHLGVPNALIRDHGVYNHIMAAEMAFAGVKASLADICVSTTGFVLKEGQEPQANLWVGTAMTHCKGPIFEFTVTETDRKKFKKECARLAMQCVIKTLGPA
jgi:PncC family amidohydrolase